MKTTEEYIKQANLVHHGKYIYDNLDYQGSKKKVCIICPKHGEFWQEANSHLKGCGCPECFKERNGDKTRIDLKRFIEKARKIHDNKYDYSKVDFVNMNTKICIICPKHGEFWQTPMRHCKGGECPKCLSRLDERADEFIKKAKEKHENKYDYSKVDYVNSYTKVCIICPIHGEFWQIPSNHLSGGGCHKCGKEKRRGNTEEFVKKSIKIHGDKYDYSKVDYVNNCTKVCIICPKHGEFHMKPNDHLSGQGCPKCGDEKMAQKSRLKVEDILNRFKKIYNGKYSYEYWDKEYKNVEDKIPIKCPEHGLFYKTVHQHLSGQGCPKCNSSILENNIRNFLIENKIEFAEQKKFPWLGLMTLDFYLPKHNIAIECQGEQHFKPFGYFGGEVAFEKQKERDVLKKELCIKNNVILLYFSNRKYNDDIITNKKELINEIKKYE